jgi:hypothetical protein
VRARARVCLSVWWDSGVSAADLHAHACVHVPKPAELVRLGGRKSGGDGPPDHPS